MTSRPRTPRRIIAAVLVALLVVGAACGDDDSSDGDPNRPSESTTSTASTTQPPASDEDTAFPIVEDLVLEATALVDDLYQDPTVIEDSDDSQLALLRDLYTDDSPTPPAVETQLRQLADNGQRMQAAASGIFRELGVYRMTVVDDDTIRFRICATEDRETIDADGNVVDQRAQVTQGTGEARRVEGRWRFYGIHPEEDRTLPIEPGTANTGFCDRLFAEDDPT